MGLFGFRKKVEPNYAAIFNKYYDKMLSTLIAAKLPMHDTIIQFELLPFMYTAGVWTVRAANLNYISFQQVIRPIIKEKCSAIGDENYFNFTEYLDREVLYFDVATGDPYRGDWLMSTAFPIELRCHMVTRCMVVLGDILLTPQCVHEYSYEGLYLNGFADTFKVYSLMMGDFHKDVLEYCQALNNGSRLAPMISPKELKSKNK